MEGKTHIMHTHNLIFVKTRPIRMRFFMRCVAIRHDASMYMHGRIVTERIATHEKRIRVGRA